MNEGQYQTTTTAESEQGEPQTLTNVLQQTWEHQDSVLRQLDRLRDVMFSPSDEKSNDAPELRACPSGISNAAMAVRTQAIEIQDRLERFLQDLV